MTTTDRLWAAAFVVLWTSGFIGAELGTRYAPALTILSWRFLLLAAPALAWVLWRRRRYTARDVGVHVAIGLLAQVGYLYGVVMASQLGVDAGTTALIAALQPVVTAVAAFIALGEPVRAAQIGGLAIGFAGVALVVSADYSVDGTALWTYALPVGAMLSLVAATILERRAGPTKLGALDALAVHFLATAAVFAVLASTLGELAPPGGAGFWGAVAWMTLMAGLGGYGSYWVVVRRSGATAAATLLYLTPPTTVLWAWAMFGTAPAAVAWLGMGVTAAGVALALKRSGRGVLTQRPRRRPSRVLAECGQDAKPSMSRSR